MFDPRFAKLLAADRRYKPDAYAFVEEALAYAHESLGMGTEHPADEPSEPEEPARAQSTAQRTTERHLTGQELCEAIRQYALDQYGYMAKPVLNAWGVTTTGDFGNIVFNLIDIKRMKKTKQDRREDFENVYKFEVAFCQEFQIKPAENSHG